MKKRYIGMGVLCVAILVGINIGLAIRDLSKITLDTPIITVYRYQSTDYGFEDIEVPEKGRSLETVEGFFEEYITENNLKNVELRITTEPSEWDNLRHRRWNYKYMEFVEQDNKTPIVGGE